MGEIKFEFYFNKYNCQNDGELTPENFDLYIERAKRELGSFCNVEAAIMQKSESVMLCICEIAENLCREENTYSIKSENIDGYAVTFERKQNINSKIKKIVCRCLGDTGLIYAGVEE